MPATGIESNSAPCLIRNILAVLTFIAALAGCTNEEQNNTALRDSLRAAKNEKLAAAKNSEPRTEFEGLYNYDKYGSTFRDCLHPDSVYIVIDNTGRLMPEFQNIFSGKNVYGSLKIKVKGVLIPTEEQKHKDKHPVSLRIIEVQSVEKKTPGNTCIPYDYWATGSNPDWSLQISKKENIIEFFDGAEGKLYSFFWNEPRSENGILVYSSFNTVRKYSIIASITRQKCADPGTGTEREYTAEVELTGGKKFKGCAFKGK